MVDATKRKLTLPPGHLPYLEKHRIVEVYRELVRELVIHQPYDHVLFMKQMLQNAYHASRVSRVVLLCSPKVNCIEVAKQIAIITGQRVITSKDVLATAGIKRRSKLSSEKLAVALSQLTRTDNAYKTGWIITDCINSGKDAKKMLEIGVLPTHVIHLIPPFSPPLTELLYCNVLEEWPDYRRTIMEIRDVFKNKLIEVFLGSSILEEVVTRCVDLINVREGYGGPLKPRVLILGPRGSGRKTQANLLASTMNLVNIDFEYLLCQVWISDTELGQKLRDCREEVCYRSDLLCQVVNKRILEPDCLERGWVMTGFPFTEVDFKYFDCLDTPPNRVIFLECDLNICKERLTSRKINAYTGSVTNVAEQPDSVWYKHLNTHPKDRAAMINAELSYYCEQYGHLRTYCGGTAAVLNGDQPQRWVHECIAAVIMRASPPVPPREPCLEKKKNIEEKQEQDKSCSTVTSTPSLLFNSYVTHEEQQKDILSKQDDD